MFVSRHRWHWDLGIFSLTSAVVEPSTHGPKIKGSHPASGEGNQQKHLRDSFIKMLILPHINKSLVPIFPSWIRINLFILSDRVTEGDKARLELVGREAAGPGLVEVVERSSELVELQSVS